MLSVLLLLFPLLLMLLLFLCLCKIVWTGSISELLCGMACYKTLTVDGMIFPASFSPDNFLSLKTYVPDDDDIYIVTFPKCGTTWMMYILYLIQNDCPERNFKMDDHIPQLEQVGAAAMKKYPRPRIIKSHLPFDRLPWSDRAKYIFIARNPFDCCVSFFHHAVGFVQHYDFADGKFEDFFDTFVKGLTESGDYFDHLNSLFNARGRENVLFLTFESMKEDPKLSILKVANFLGGEFEKKVEDLNFLEKVVQLSSLSSMKKKESSFHSGRAADKTPFVRKGIIGDYKNTMSDEQIKILGDCFREKCQDSEVLKLWEKYGIPS